MRTLKASVLAALAGGALLSAPAAASPGWTLGDVRLTISGGQIHLADYHGGYAHRYALPFYEVRRILRRDGFRQIRFERERDRVYVVSARDYRGDDVRIRVNKFTGEIRNVSYAGAHSVSQRDARFILRDRGFRQIHFVESRPRFFIAHATGPRGFRVAVRVNRYSGDVIRLGRI